MLYRLAYADYLLSVLMGKSVLPSTLYLLYDVGCKLLAHWKVQHYCRLITSISVFPLYFVFQANSEVFQELLDKCIVAVPVFHAYAHNASCQHQFSPRNIEGFGLTDGENVERLWSYLGRFARMTKEMSSGNRVDLLTDALSHYCEQKRRKLGECKTMSNLRVVLTYMYIHTSRTDMH